MNVIDLDTLGHSIGFAPTLDNPKAAKHPTTISANQYKVGRYVDITNTTGSGVYGASGLITGAQLNSEFRPYYQVSCGYMYWHDYAVIKLNDLFESLNKIGLVKRFDAQLCLWVNTGTVNVTVSTPNASNTGYNLTPADNTFSNTCPIMVNYHAGATGIVPDTEQRIVAGLYIARPPTTSFAGINLAANVLAHPLPNCRLYYSQVTVEPQERVLFIGTQFSNLYTAVDTPVRGRVGVCVVFVCKYVLGHSRVSQPLNLRLCLLWHFGFLTSQHASPTCRRRRLNSYRLFRRSTPGPPPIPCAHLFHLPVSPAIMAIPYTGLSFAASCNSRSSHGQYTRSSTEHYEYGAVTSVRLLGQNYRNRKYSKVRNYVLDKHLLPTTNNGSLRFLIAHALNTSNRLAA
jgi:hypothetical protein